MAGMIAVIREVIRDVASPGVADKVTVGDGLVDGLGLDSLGLVRLQVGLEAKLNIRFDPLEVDLTEVFDTVGSLARYLESVSTAPEELQQGVATAKTQPAARENERS